MKRIMFNRIMTGGDGGGGGGGEGCITALLVGFSEITNN